MSRWLRRIGTALGVLVLVVAVLVGFAWVSSNKALARTYDVAAAPITVMSDSLIVARGEHLVMAIAKCVDCHGPDLGGAVVADAQPMFYIAAPNLTLGVGGVLGKYTDAQLARVIRNGIKQDGRPVFLMPSDEYQIMTDEDVTAIIAYVRSVAPVNRTMRQVALGPLGRALLATGQLPLIAADRVDHARIHDERIVADSTVTYGTYLAHVGGCTGCHGAGLSGGPIPGMPPDAPPAANLTPTGLGHYTDAQVETILRTGTRPDGTKLNEFMPYKATALMTPLEMSATIKYLRTVPPKDFGSR